MIIEPQEPMSNLSRGRCHVSVGTVELKCMNSACMCAQMHAHARARGEGGDPSTLYLTTLRRYQFCIIGVNRYNTDEG